ncbi:hypothetical protein BC832DRAFT_165470 [Gaertneriomyces semiglobifer]|nr:hypothetical protein BC832DRAFT_165470 [Gaertneriomyces semiglobifer]
MVLSDVGSTRLHLYIEFTDWLDLLHQPDHDGMYTCPLWCRGRGERTGKVSVDAAALNSNRGAAAAFRRVPASRSLLGGRKSRPEAPIVMLSFPSDGLPLVPSTAFEARQTEVASAVVAVGTVDVAVVAEMPFAPVAVGIVDVAGLLKLLV